MVFIYLFYCGSNLSHAGTRLILLKRVQQELSVVLQTQADSPGQFLKLYNAAQEHSVHPRAWLPRDFKVISSCSRYLILICI